MIDGDVIEPCTELDQFFETVEIARRELGFAMHEECFYRGHSDSRYQLLPGLYRHKRAIGCDDDYICEIESALFFEFEARARELHGSGLTGWDVLQFMQHHGVPTRLLDWSETLAVALYFALLEARADAIPCVWLLNPYALNEEGGWDRDLIAPPNIGWAEDENSFYDYGELLLEPEFEFECPVAIYPVQRSARLHAQRGYFTIHGDDYGALDEFEIADSVLRCVRIAPQLVPQLKRFLQRAGMDRLRLFPDLDNLSISLRERYVANDAARFAAIRQSVAPILSGQRLQEETDTVVQIIARVETTGANEDIRKKLRKALPGESDTIEEILSAIAANITHWAP